MENLQTTILDKAQESAYCSKLRLTIPSKIKELALKVSVQLWQISFEDR